MIVQSTYLNQQILLALTEHLGSGGFSGPLYDMNLALIAAGFAPTPGTAFNQLTEATYSGYARQSGITWGVPILQGDGSYQTLSQLTQWQGLAASNFVNNVIYGWVMIDNSSSPNVLLAEAFQTPVAIAVPGDGFGLVLQLSEGALNPASQGNVIY